MSTLHRMKTYVRHYLRAKRGGHGVHSPFVYQLAREVFPAQKTDTDHPAERWHQRCLENANTIRVTDFGTGVPGPRRVCDIARQSTAPASQALLLARLIRQFKPEYMLELGTSLGVTTIYQSMAARPEKFVTIEGCPEIAYLAENALAKAAPGVKIVTGNFDEVLPGVLEAFPCLDYVYFDGNHRLEPTLRYFEWCLPLANEKSLFVFDDIHWSPGMEEAWKRICAHERVTVSIDLYDVGLVFFRKEQVKEHFVLFS